MSEESKIILDGQEVTEEQLKEAQTKPKSRVIKLDENVYKSQELLLS